MSTLTRTALVLLILLFSLVARCYYFSLTNDQPVWWDEAVYLLKAKNIALGTPDTGFDPHRPIMLPLIMSGFYAIALGENAIRVAVLLSSVASVWLVYLIAARLCNDMTGLVAALLYSLLPLEIFYSMRILTEIPHVTLGMLGIYCFLTKRPRLVRLSCSIFVLAALIRFQAVFLFFVVVVLVFATDGVNALRNRNYFLSLVLGLLVALPYLIWMQTEFGHPLYPVLMGIEHTGSSASFSARANVLLEYMGGYARILPLSVLLLAGLGLLPLFDFHGRLSGSLQLRETHLKVALLLSVWWLLPSLGHGFFADHFEPRYMLMSYPPLLILAALGVVWMFGILEPAGRFATGAYLFVVVMVASYHLWESSDPLIRRKVSSYNGIREAGSWLRERATKTDRVMSQSVPQLTYYSELATYGIPGSRARFLSAVKEVSPRYIVVSGYESHPKWVLSAPFEVPQGFELVKRIERNNTDLVVLEATK